MSDNNDSPMNKPGHFSWNELITTEVEAAKKYYSNLFGWKMEGFDQNYTILKKGDDAVGGLMKAPQPGMPSHWLAYITVENVDATAEQAAKLGGKVCAPPFDVPNVGRIAVLMDPQGAAFGVFKAAM